MSSKPEQFNQLNQWAGRCLFFFILMLPGGIGDYLGCNHFLNPGMNRYFSHKRSTPGWMLSDYDGRNELEGFWEIEEEWNDKLPIVSQRVSVPWDLGYRRFLWFSRGCLFVVRYSPSDVVWSLEESRTLAYADDGEGAIDIYQEPLVTMLKKGNLYYYLEDFSCARWKLKDDRLFLVRTNTLGANRKFGEKSRPMIVPDEPCLGVWYVAKKVDTNAEAIEFPYLNSYLYKGMVPLPQARPGPGPVQGNPVNRPEESVDQIDIPQSLQLANPPMQSSPQDNSVKQ